MTDRAEPMFRLKSEHSLPELVAGVTAVSFAVTGAYYWGFFSELGTSLVSTLTVHDFLAGGLIAIAPTVMALAVGTVLRVFDDKGRVVSDDGRTPWQKLSLPEKLIIPLWFSLLPVHLVAVGKGGLAIALLIIGSLFSWWLTSSRLNGSTADVATFTLVVAVCFGWIGVAVGFDLGRGMLTAALILTLLVSSFTLGRVGFFQAVSSARDHNTDVVQLTSGAFFAGRVSLFTTANVYLTSRQGFTQIIPMASVRLIKKTQD